jgi:hypothetical protein
MATTYRVTYRLYSAPDMVVRMDSVNLTPEDAMDAYDRRITMEDMVVITLADRTTGDPDDIELLSYYVSGGPRLVPSPHPGRAHERYVAMVRAIGDGFHPDTAGADYVTLPAPYTPELVDEIVTDAWRVMDPYIVALDVLNGGTGHGDA